MPIMLIMTKPLVLTSKDPVLNSLNFKPYRSTVERHVVPFIPAPGKPQTIEIKTPWGAHLTARKGDLLVSEVDSPDDYWPVDPIIFDETYEVIRPGICVKKATTLLVPLVEVTGRADDQVTVSTLEGDVTVRAGDFYLARGIQGEIWPYPKDKIGRILIPAE